MHAAPLTPNLLRANSRTNEQWVSRRDHNRAVRRANEEGKGNGLAVGLLFAMYEHFKHRRNEKRLTKEVAQGVKKQQRSEENARFAANEHARQETLTQAELRRTQQQVERLAAEKASPKLEQVQPAEGQLKAPEGFELRLDGAYLTQVRKGTGEAVDPTAFQRGHEIHSELRKEKTPAAQRNAAAGEVALVAAAMSSRGSTPGGGSGAGTVGTSGSPAGVPPIPAGIPTARTQGLPPSRNGMTQPTDDQSTSSQPIWPWLVALAVVAVCLAFVLH